MIRASSWCPTRGSSVRKNRAVHPTLSGDAVEAYVPAWATIDGIDTAVQLTLPSSQGRSNLLDVACVGVTTATRLQLVDVIDAFCFRMDARQRVWPRSVGYCCLKASFVPGHIVH